MAGRRRAIQDRALVAVVAATLQLAAVAPARGDAPASGRVLELAGTLAFRDAGQFTFTPDTCVVTASNGSANCTSPPSTGDYAGTPCAAHDLTGDLAVRTGSNALLVGITVASPGDVAAVTGDFAGDGSGPVTGTMHAARPGGVTCATEWAVRLVLALGEAAVGGGGVQLLPKSAADVAAMLAASDPVLVAAKTADAARNAPFVTAQLGATVGPVKLCTPGTLPPPFADCPPTRYDASISAAQRQERWYWCVPASAAIMLGSTNPAAPSQSQLAYEMKTSERDGTYLAKAVPVLNKYRNPAPPHHPWALQAVETPRKLLDVMVTETWTYRQSAMIPIVMNLVGYYPSSMTQFYSHAVVGFGYDLATRSIHVFDPYDGRFGERSGPAAYGEHYVPVDTLWKATVGQPVIA